MTSDSGCDWRSYRRGTSMFWDRPAGHGAVHSSAPSSFRMWRSAKLSSDGTLLWHTFFGGRRDADFQGRVGPGSPRETFTYRARSEHSWGSPISPFVGQGDTFAAKFDPSSVLQWNTFLGSSQPNHFRGIAVDLSGSIYAASAGIDETLGQSRFVRLRAARYCSSPASSPNGHLEWHSFVGSSLRLCSKARVSG